jgi:D-alanyl-D-alanine carboxypeptidase
MKRWAYVPGEDALTKNKLELTQRQKIQIRSHIQKALVVLLGLGILAVMGLVIGRAALSHRIEKAAEAEQLAIQQAAEEARLAEQARLAAEQAAIEEANRPPQVDVTAWNLRLVSKEEPLTEDFEPELTEIEREEFFDSRASDALKELIAQAREDGYTVYVCSAYRSYQTQYEIYWNHVWTYMRQDGMTQPEAEATTQISVNYPGVSEHQLGLAVDLLEQEDQDMQPYIGGSGLMLWLEEHCAEYGFVIRYPDGKTDITGIEYEPWHLRYVGQEAATYMMEHQLCLEEFLALYE